MPSTSLPCPSALVAFALVVSTATAAAEGGWVLWLTPIMDNPRWESNSRREFRTLDECDRHAALMLSELRLMDPNAALEPRCHPITADPREAMRKPTVK